jgi:hypothetical protein
VLRAIGQELERDLREGSATREGALRRGELLRRSEDVFSSSVQLTARSGVLAEDPARELQRLAEVYLVHREVGERERRVSGRAAIRGAMEQAFRDAGVLELMRSVRASEFAAGRDPLVIDFGYAPRNRDEFRMYHAVSVETDAGAAKELAWSYPRVRDGMLRQGKRAELSAVVNDGVDEEEFAIAAMREAEIRVVPVSGMLAEAERARRSLIG